MTATVVEEVHIIYLNKSRNTTIEKYSVVKVLHFKYYSSKST